MKASVSEAGAPVDGSRTAKERIETFLVRYNVAIEIVMAVLAIAFVFLGATNDGRFGIGTTVTWALEWAITAVFVAEYVARMYVAADKARFVRGHVVDVLAIASSLATVPGFQMLRLLRLFRFIRAFSRTTQLFDALGRPFDDPLLAYGGIGFIILIFAGTGAFLEFEVGENPLVKNAGDAFWMAFSTVFTLGFASAKPVTVAGRFVSGLLIIGGLTCISFFTTTLTNRFHRHDREAEAARLERIETMLAVIDRKLDERTALPAEEKV